MSKLEILGGGGGEVTGSSFKYTSDKGGNLVIDAGLFQGEGESIMRNKSFNGLDPEEIDGVFVTHAHLDHLGRLPFFHKSDADIFMTPATHDIARVALKNAAALSPRLYPNGSVEAVLRKTTRVPYETPVAIDGVKVKFKDAGHILGSSTLQITEEGGQTIVFSGDLGNKSRIVKPTTPPDEADIVVIETTYGDRNHSTESPMDVLKEAIERVKKNNSTLLIPAFAIDRTQSLLNILKEMRRDGELGNIPVYSDSPMANVVTNIYDREEHRQLFNDQLKEVSKPFSFPGLQRTDTIQDSDAIRHRKGAKIIIAGSGMMNGGRIGKHAENHLGDKNSVLLLIGYAAEGTPGREILEGERNVEIGGKLITINGEVMSTSSMSAHAGQDQLMNWVRYIQGGNKRLRSVVLVHGRDKAREAFAEKIKMELGIENVIMPKENEVIDFDRNKHVA